MTVEFETPSLTTGSVSAAATGRHRVAWRSPAAAGPADVPLPLSWAFYAFVFALPVETIGLGMGIPASGTRILGYFFFLVALLYPGVSFRRIPTALGWFGLYLLVYAVLGMFQPSEYWEEIYERVFTLVQLEVLLWASFNLLRSARVARGALVALGLSCTLLAALQAAGLGAPPADPTEGRAVGLGQNPNEVAGYFAVGLLALVGLASGRGPWRLLAWPLVAVVGVAVVQTGSRGGLLALGAGVATFLLVGRTPRVRWRNAAILVLVAAAAVVVLLLSEASRRRWEATLTTGNLSHREQLYPIAWDMFLDQPVLGVGPVTGLYELGWRTRHVLWHYVQAWREPHNSFLYVATATGLLGLVPFLIGLGLCLGQGWRARGRPDGLLPLALLVTMLAASMSGTWIHLKLFWFVLAYALASGSLLAGPVVAWSQAVPQRGRTARAAGQTGVVPT
jgi:O-antigen ligase